MLESSNANKKLELKIELLEENVKNLEAETNDALKLIEDEREELKIYKAKSLI